MELGQDSIDTFMKWCEVGMADLIRLERGLPPWKPTAQARTTTFHRFSRPLIGLIEQDGSEYLFWCAFGEAAEVSMWIYTHLTPKEAAILRTSAGEGRDALIARLAEVTADDRSAIAAIAISDHGLVIETVVEPGVQYGQQGTVLRAAEALDERLNEAKRASETIISESRMAVG